jgi:hypothetical protein
MLLATAGALFLSPAAIAQTTGEAWIANQLAKGFSLTGLPAPGGVGTAALRLQDVAVCAGIPWSIGINGAFRCSVDGTDYLSPSTGLLAAGHAATSIVGRAAGSSGVAADISCPTPGTFLGNVGGTLSCSAAAGVFTPDAPLGFSGSHLQLTLDGTTVGVFGGAVQRLALTFSGAVTGTMAAGSGSLATAFGSAAGLSVLGVTGSSSAVPAYFSSSANNQVLQELAGTLQFHALDFSQLTGTPPAITSLTGPITGTGPGATATTITANAVTLANLQQIAGLSLPGVSGGSTANMAPITASANNQVMQELGGALQFHTLDFSQLTGTPPAMTSVTGDVVGSGPGATATTIQPNVVSFSKTQQIPAFAVVANPTSSTANETTVACSADGQFIGRAAGALTCTSTIAATSAPLTAGAVGFGSSGNLLTGDATNFHWDAPDLRLGLREAVPAFQLHVVDEAGAADRGAALQSSFTSTTGMAYRLLKSNGSFGSPTPVVSGTYDGRFEWAPYDGSQYLTTAAILAQTVGTVTVGNIPTRLILAAARGGLSSDPTGSSQDGLYLTASASGHPSVTIPGLAISGSSPVVFLSPSGGTLESNANLDFSSNTLRIGPPSGTAGGPTAGTWPLVVTGGAALAPTITIAPTDTGFSSNIAMYGPYNAQTLGLFTWVAPGSAEATAVGVTNSFVFSPLINVSAGTADSGSVVFRGISAPGGTRFNAFTVDPYGSTTWYNSSAPTSPAGAASIRANGGLLQYSEHGGAWISFDSFASGITSLNADVVATGPGAAAATIQANVVSNAKLRQSGALAIVGRSVNSAGNVADIQATAASGGVMRENGSTIGFGSITEGIVTNLVTDLAGKQATGNYVTSGTGPVTFSGPGAAATTVNLGVGGFSGLLPITDLSVGSSGQVIEMSGGVPTWVTPSAGTVYAGVSPVVVSGSNISCPTCNTATLAAIATSGSASDLGTGTVAAARLGSFTNGSVLFWNGGLAQDNSGFFYDSANHRLGLGNTTPSYSIDIIDTANAQVGTRFTNLSAGSSAEILNQAANNSGGIGFWGVSGAAYTGFVPLNGGQAFFGSDNTSLSIFTETANDIVFYANSSEAGRFQSAGAFKLSSLTTGLVESIAGILQNATPSDIAALQVWPATGEINVSTGTGSAPIGDSTFTFNTSTHTMAVNDVVVGLNLNLALAAQGIAVFDASGNLGTGTVGPGLHFSLGTLSAATAKLNYYDIAIQAGSSGGYMATSTAALTGGGVVIEYPLGIAASTCTITANVINNTISPGGGNSQFFLTQNGSAVASILIPNGSSGVFTQTHAVTSGATTDTWGVSATGTAPSGGSMTLTVTATVN